MVCASLSLGAMAQEALAFEANAGMKSKMTVYDGTEVNYMASPATQPQAGDATGRALKEGYVVVIPGTRGRNSSIVADKVYAKKHRGVKKGQTIFTGRAPKAILDLKAAIRYLFLLHSTRS